VGGSGVVISGSSEDSGIIGNYISGQGLGIGINNTGTDSKIFNNLVQNFDTNYSGVPLTTIEQNPDEATRFWANLSRAEA
jgi:hypothetical protein